MKITTDKISKQVKIAQEHKHAHAVIIVDREDSEYNSQTIQNIIPADDGYGSQADGVG